METIIRESNYQSLKSKLTDISYEGEAKWHVIMVNIEALGVSKERHRAISENSLPQMFNVIERTSDILWHCFIEETHTIILLCSDNILDVEGVVENLSNFYGYTEEIGEVVPVDDSAIQYGTIDQALPYLQQMMQADLRDPATKKLSLPPVSAEVSDDYYTEKFTKNSQIPTILVIDDEPHIHSLLRSIVGRDYHLIRAFNAQSAVYEFLNQQPDLCILDIGLPDMSGCEVARWLRQVDAHAAIIMLSGSQRKEDQYESEILGVNHYLSKPFQAVKLKQAIEDCVSKPRSQAQVPVSSTGSVRVSPSFSSSIRR